MPVPADELHLSRRRDDELEASARELASGFAAAVQAFAELPARLEASARALAGGLEEYARAGIVERTTEHGGYRGAADVAEAELRELERRRRRPSVVPFRLAVVREVRSFRRPSRPPVVRDRGGRPRRPAGRRRRPTAGRRRSDSRSDPDLDDADDGARARAGAAELDSTDGGARRRSSC
jgi:hypothetical protein